MKQVNWKKALLPNLPYVFIALFCTKLGQAARLAAGADFAGKFLHFLEGLSDAFAVPLPSFHPVDLCVGIAIAAAIRLGVYVKGKNAKKFRKNMEYGSARWGTAEDIRPYVDPVFENNIILTQTESLTMNNYFVKAELNQADGVYYVVGHAADEADATHFIPVDSKGNPGKVIIKGVEDDEYIITEVRTDNGYTLLKEAITVAISQKASSQLCDCYSRDVLGLIQNDPRYASIIQDNGSLHNIPQRHLEHALLTATATVDGNSVSMLADGNSKNAEAPLSVVNTRGFDLPKTGDNGTMFITVTGIVMMAAAAVVIILATRKKNKR